MKWLLISLALFASSTSQAQLLEEGDQYEVWKSKVCQIYRCVVGADTTLVWNHDLTENLTVTRDEVNSVMAGLNAAYASATPVYAVNHAADRELEKLYGTNAALDHMGKVCTAVGVACGAAATAFSVVTIGGSLGLGLLCGVSAYECLGKIETAKIKVTMRIEHIKKACDKDDQACYEEITGDTGPKVTEKPVEGPAPRPIPPPAIFPITGGGLGHGPKYEGEVSISETPPDR